MASTARQGPGDLRQPGERAAGARIEILRGTPRMLERLHHHPLGRRGIDEYRIDLGVKRQMMALAKLLVGVAVAAGDALDQSNIWRLRTGHSSPSEGGPDDSWRSGRPGRASTGYGEGAAPRAERGCAARRGAPPATGRGLAAPGPGESSPTGPTTCPTQN